jgi:NADPH:quinone reductase-like Zn-dependent oxidoreductase
MFYGGYAEYTCVPTNQVQVIKTKIPWEQLGDLPEMMQTAWGSLFKSLQLRPEQRVFVLRLLLLYVSLSEKLC